MLSAVEYKVESNVAYFRLNRPEQLNAISGQLIRELDEAIKSAEDDPEVRVVVVTGTGRAFCAGADLSEVTAVKKSAEFYGWVRRVQRVLLNLEELPKPTIAAINGLALGGGLEISLACDLRIASETSQLGVPEIKVGLLPAAGGMSRLPALIGRGRALQMIYTGRPVTAGEALTWGLVNEVVPAEKLLNRAAELAAELAALPSLALRAGKATVHNTRGLGFHEGAKVEANAISLLFETEDTREGLSAFIGKRQPQFTGR